MESMTVGQKDLTRNTQTLAEMREIIRRLSRIIEISVTLNSTLDRDRQLNFILEILADVLDCEAASIMLYDEKRSELIFSAATGSDPAELAKVPVPLEGSIAGTIFRENRPMLINNVAEDPRHFAQVGEQVRFQPRSLLGVPMRIRNKTTGVIEALNKRKGKFTEKDAQYLYIVASQAAVAIHNAELLGALQHAYNELSQLDQLKSNFMAIASHELRTPLGLILGYASFLQEQAHGELSQHASMVLNSALRMQTLVEDMTNMNLLKVGSAQLAPSKLAIQHPLQAAYEAVKKTAEAKGLELSMNLPQRLVYVNADREKLELVFINLMNNAIRFTQSGGQIQVRAQSISNEAWVEVSDTGFGIPLDELEKIFKEFYQVEDHMTRRAGGLGLGLAIARGLVELHGGRIWAESDGPGQGATFKMVLPEA